MGGYSGRQQAGWSAIPPIPGQLPGRWPRVPEQVASPLSARPYDLRHAAVSLWLNGGVAVTEVADRAGHSVEVLLRVYAKCIDGGEEAANRRIDAALAI
jgi:integrase